jgi:phosphate transport system substrate-binding protein
LSTQHLQTYNSSAKKFVFAVFATLAVFAGVAISLSSCSGGHHDQGAKGADDDGGKRLTVQGSDTMDGMVRAWSAAFIKLHPEVHIVVQNGDTGSGIKDLIEAKVNLAAASREITADENTQAHASKVHLARSMVAKDAVALIVGPKNPVKSLTMDELKGIFSGTIAKWSQVKSKPAPAGDAAITVLGREASSGTGDYLREHVLGGKPFADTVKLMTSSQAVIDAVEKDAEAIGFVGMSQAERAGAKIKVLSIKLAASSPTDVSEEGLTGKNYPLERPLYLYSVETSGDLTKSFVEFCKSADGQKIVQDMGFMTLH